MLHPSHLRAPVNWTTTIADINSGACAKVHVRYYKRSRQINVKINQQTGQVICTVPYYGEPTRDYIERFLLDNAQTIVAWSLQFSRKFPFKPGCSIPFFGRKHTLEVSDTQESYVDKSTRTIYASETGFWGHYNLNVRHFLYDALREYCQERCKVHAQTLGVELARVDVGALKNAWGQCGNPSHNIEFHWQLVGAPARAIDCVCAHEVSHITHPHHRPSFWKTVYKCIPEKQYKKRHASLNLDQIGGQLSGLGKE